MNRFKLKDIVISILIISATLLYFYINYLIPEGLQTINVLGFEIGSFGFPDIYHLVYYSKMKFLLLLFAITWYLTCEYWWKPAILVIITIELFKLITALNSNQQHIDDIDYLASLPVTLPIILLLIYISRRLNYYNLARELQLDIDQEVDDLFFELNDIEKNRIEVLNENLINLKKVKEQMNSEKYLKNLISLRDDFYKGIN
ncbi:hypothetical protein [Psychroserpens jangbogonensis]|uniref:hypothetical protein n=1 Tax=Psychroserpens jangbogonensis TaxID=1484460 RepID=UPI00053DAFAE|nr:hypothetical protein [Psychroserpens jangbogonensis]